MKNLEQHFANYSEYHQTKGNKITHFVGIPLIMFSTLGLLSLIKIPISSSLTADVGLLVWALSLVFYACLDWLRAMPFSFITFGMYAFALNVPVGIHVLLFVLGWVLQGIGHYKYEKKSPAFLTNVSHLLIGPFWIFCSIVDLKK